MKTRSDKKMQGMDSRCTPLVRLGLTFFALDLWLDCERLLAWSDIGETAARNSRAEDRRYAYAPALPVWSHHRSAHGLDHADGSDSNDRPFPVRFQPGTNLPHDNRGDVQNRVPTHPCQCHRLYGQPGHHRMGTIPLDNGVPRPTDRIVASIAFLHHHHAGATRAVAVSAKSPHFSYACELIPSIAIKYLPMVSPPIPLLMNR